MRRLAAVPVALAILGALAVPAVQARSAPAPLARPVAAPRGRVSASPSAVAAHAAAAASQDGALDPIISSPPPAIPQTGTGVGAPGLQGLPSGVPQVALDPEPALDEPSTTAWPFANDFPRTSGTGRTIPGAVEWSDFLYDDHGAKGVPRSFPIAGLAPTAGTFEYSGAKADRNGADLFRIGIGEDAAASYWRVDWNTLADPNEPIVSFGLATTADTAVHAWPGIAGLNAGGVDHAVMISAQGAWLLDSGGARTVLPAPTVDAAAQSFVLKIPNTALPTTGTWRVYAVSGEANATGDGFAAVDANHGSVGSQPPVFNVGFRGVAQEPPGITNYWMESAQAAALAGGDVSPFSQKVDWDALPTAADTREPLVRGYSNRWYVSSIKLGDGVVADDSNAPAGDTKPNFLGRVQPYAVYVPTTYDPATPTALTWVLHSLSEQHNQYGSIAPNFLRVACEERHSICATTLGRGPDGWYYGEAELDFWEVWNRLAMAYNLDPDTTAITGYSMGGWGTYKLGFEHPDLFAQAVVLAGPPGCGARLADPQDAPFPLGIAQPDTACASDGDSTPLIPNARWLPYFIGHGTDDELVPVTGVVEQVNAFRTDGNQFRFELYPGMDHLAWGTSDLFTSAAKYLDGRPRFKTPDHVTFSWYPHLNARWPFANGAYWVRDPQARAAAAGTIATIDAVSAAQPFGPVSLAVSAGATNPGDGPPVGTTLTQTWNVGAPPAAGTTISLVLTDVASVTVDLAGAGFAPGQAGSIHITSDGPTTVTLLTSHGAVPPNPDGSFTA